MQPFLYRRTTRHPVGYFMLWLLASVIEWPPPPELTDSIRATFYVPAAFLALSSWQTISTTRPGGDWRFQLCWRHEYLYQELISS